MRNGGACPPRGVARSQSEALVGRGIERQVAIRRCGRSCWPPVGASPRKPVASTSHRCLINESPSRDRRSVRRAIAKPPRHLNRTANPPRPSRLVVRSMHLGLRITTRAATRPTRPPLPHAAPPPRRRTRTPRTGGTTSPLASQRARRPVRNAATRDQIPRTYPGRVSALGTGPHKHVNKAITVDPRVSLRYRV